ncbi:2-hydroxyacid dehydrogenase [Rhodohalobacter sulfatireducens]|uniref:Glyoxylate/hydroxypyruvate reductase A n=1 Tax=Rhodohalobacter sulfatireducens TaxID=2911366 RepID=A0ABS9KFB0_9BACT|nr:glyoxylate/hydroxypyruvate reductase A [Rhodohalobacter sulfatireducens]MCG2589544.1 glyoxylate/hydroxypyruvate reductase A [Rhodohalobacter sulfatireducens]
MSILLVAKDRNLKPFKEALHKADRNLDIETWPNVDKPERVQFAVAWNQPKNVFDSYPNLKVISSLGAGVDHLLNDSTIPDHITFTKITEQSLVTQMIDYVYACVLSIMLKLDTYRDSKSWNPQRKFTREDLNIGVMGLGNIGKEVAIYLADQGFCVSGLSHSKKDLPDIQTFTPDQTDDFLSGVSILVNLLPLTGKTEGILDLDLFKKLTSPSFLINAARGDHLIDEDLIYALDTNIIEEAYLDVFSEEPLPDSHPFWNRKNIHITPHIAGGSDPDNVAEELTENYKRLLSGMELKNVVDREKGY